MRVSSSVIGSGVSISTHVIVMLILGLFSWTHSAYAQSVVATPARDLDSASPIAAFARPSERAALVGTAFEKGTAPQEPIALAHFSPAGSVITPAGALKGALKLAPIEFSIRAYGKSVESRITISEITLPLITYKDRILPVPDPESVVIDRRRRFTLLFGVGRIWQESGDAGRSRALMPVSLIDSTLNTVRNGLATFLYGADQTVSNVFFQFSQETAPNGQADLWALAEASFAGRSVPGAVVRTKVFEHRLATSPVYRDWPDLERKYGVAKLAGFDGPVGRAGNVVVSGVMDGDVTYLKGCITRHGAYPFCRQMRHAVTTLSQTLYGLVIVAYLVDQFGLEVLTKTIGELVPELRDHPQWQRVTLRDLINMASGLGETGPVQVPGYVQADQDAMSVKMREAETVAAKLAVAAQYPSYPWEPGKVFRFRTADSFVLSLALDRYVKSRNGKYSSLRWVVQEGLFRSLGIPRMQMRMTVGRNPAARVPDIATGLFPSTGEIVRLLVLMRHAQAGMVKTGVSSVLIQEALSIDLPLGLPSGLNFPAGPGRYHLSLWRTPMKISNSCRLDIPSGYGTGGTVVSFMPRNLTAFRIADGDPAIPETRDSSDLRRVGNAIRPFCQS